MRTPSKSAVVLASIFVLATACSSTTTVTPVTDAGTAAPSGDAGVDASALADTGADAAEPEGDTGPAVDSAVPAEDTVGAISAVSDGTVGDAGTQGLYRAGAYFVRRPHVVPVAPTTVGPCVVETFDASDQGVPEQDVSAGAIHITGGKVPIDLVPDSKGVYASVKSQSSTLWNGGETLTVTGAGSGVPVFTASLVAPSRLTLLTPTLPKTTIATITIPRSAPFALTWDGASSGSVIVYLDIATQTKAYSVTCTFKPSDGGGQVPTAALAMLPAGDGTFDVYMKTHALVPAPMWTVGFNATTALVDTNGRITSGQTKLQ